MHNCHSTSWIAIRYTYDYKVPKDTVIAIEVWPLKPVSVGEANIDLKKFKATCSLRGVTTYIDLEEGYAIEVHEEKVKYYIYHPTKKNL